MISTFWARQQTKLAGHRQFGENGIKTGSEIALAEGQTLRDDAGTDTMRQHPYHLSFERRQGNSGRGSVASKRRSTGLFPGEVHAGSPTQDDGVEDANPASVCLFR